MGLFRIAVAQVGDNEVFIRIETTLKSETSQASGVDFSIADADQRIGCNSSSGCEDGAVDERGYIEQK
ncbi:MAG: hypothetical protein IPG59_11665 [Candidatus Melainabacteria bacterium]|nr:MAG: hypothetical protein IPG59_11665 [Candidatus Melainabacteria bacterium]